MKALWNALQGRQKRRSKWKLICVGLGTLLTRVQVHWKAAILIVTCWSDEREAEARHRRNGRRGGDKAETEAETTQSKNEAEAKSGRVPCDEGDGNANRNSLGIALLYRKRVASECA